MNRVCVVWQDGWHLAVLTGRSKDVLPDRFTSVRAACRAAARRNQEVEVLFLAAA